MTDDKEISVSTHTNSTKSTHHSAPSTEERKCEGGNRNHGGQFNTVYTEQRIWRTIVCIAQDTMWLWWSTRHAVQSGGSHGVALLSHRQDSSSVYARFSPDMHLSCTCTRRFACMRARGEGGQRKGTCILPCETNLLFLSPPKPKMDVTECYRLKNNFHLLGPPISAM